MSGTKDSRRETDVLVCEDDSGMRDLLVRILDEAGWSCEAVDRGEAALALCRKRDFGVVVTDLKMPGMDGMELLRRLREVRPGLPVIVLTAFGTVPGAVEAMKLGAFDFLTKPLPSPESLREVVARALGRRSPGREGKLLAEDPAFLNVLKLAEAVAERDTTVLLLGESGSGKEVLARYIHEKSPRAQGPFVAVNCAAIPESLLESELFGHEKGAFTGATQSRPGYFERASGGTLLLDEVGELPEAIQAKFLRVLEEREVQRVGGRAPVAVDVRVVAATNRDLEEEVAAGRFRADLFFRLNVFPIRIPPLRERPGDILPLARKFLADAVGPGKSPPVLSKEAERTLLSHSWPGNVRELENAMERAVILARDGVVRPEHLMLGRADRIRGGGQPLNLKEMERLAIQRALEATGGNRRKAAELLGIALRTLQYKIREYGLK